MIDIRLSLNRLKKHIKENTLASILLSISSILCILFFTNLFVRYMPFFGDKKENNSKYRFYNIIFSSPLNFEQVKGLDDILPELDSLKLTNVDEQTIYYDDSDIKTFISTYFLETEFINDIELENSNINKLSELNDNEVLVPHSFKAHSFKDIKNIDNKDIDKLDFAGYWDGADYLVNLKTFFNVTKANQVIFRTKEVLSSNELKELNKELLKYPIKSINTPTDVYSEDYEMSKTIIIFLNIIYALSIISYSSLFWFFINMIEKDLRVYRIVGMTKLRVFKGLMIDIFSFITLCSIFSFILHEIFWDIFFNRASNYLNDNLTIKEYLIIYVLVCILSLIVISPYVLKSLNDIYNNKKVRD